ncbi:hypothetical protein QE422_004001 [Chryseobacterium sp. SORGH_AS 447]|uniref:hypothetical protein n=1 Tax=Chryseobacterium sp. SORGH_AS_0447 TaxID=3041769 RepID=UPI0027800E51|nr:hypothetical protein [Chryseobacterium sp. SORGH_AS_0447]MDQ1163633.1 hypothetical protein [Chryseobacterium sp. SORGH_AS_0447]
MKFYLILFSFFTQIFICRQVFSKEYSIKIIKETETRKWREEVANYQKEQCYRDSLRAVNESKLKNKYYINIAAPYGDRFIPSEELKILLKKYDIIWGGEWMGSDIGGYAPNSCYYTYMTKLTREKFGEEFIDNLIKKSVSNYVKKHPDKIFDEDEHTDWKYKGTYTDVSGKDVLNKDFSNAFLYPKDYDYTKNKYNSQTIAIINLDNTGKVLKIEKFYHHIYNENNQKYIPYFEKEIKKFIQNCKFEPLKYAGYPVKSKIGLRFFYK